MSYRRNPEFMPALRREVSDRVGRSINHIQTEAEMLLEAPGSGEHYPGLPRRSSAPGEPPVTQFGELEESLGVSPTRETTQTISAAMGSPLVKARFLEAGTSIREPRPFLLPALLGSRDAVMRIFGGADG